MKPTRLLLLSALFYATLLAVFGPNIRFHDTTPATTTRPPAIVYSPISTAPPTTDRTTVAATTTSVEPAPAPLPPVPLVGPDTPCQEWVPEAVQAGWPENRDILETLMSIMWRESRCDPAALSKSSDHGLLQVNEIHRAYVKELYGIPFELAMADPIKNLNFAWHLYAEREAEGKCGWQPWSIKCR